MTEHRYDLTVTWDGDRGSGTSSYPAYGREHTVHADGRPEIAGSADPGFRGDATRWNPEQLLLVSLSQCHMLTYLHLCSQAGVVVVGYTDRPTGVMTTDRSGAGQFTEVLLRPAVVVESDDQVERARELHVRAHRACFIARSVNFPVRHDPEVRVRE